MHAIGHDVEVLLLSDRGPLQKELDELGISTWCAGINGVHRLTSEGGPIRAIAHDLYLVVRILNLFLHVARGRYDVFHAFLFHTYVLLVPWAWVLRIPVRIAARRGLHASLRKTVLLGPLTRLSTAAASTVLANSYAVAEDAHVHENVPWSKLEVIHNGLAIPTERARPDVDPPVGLLVANLIGYKGHLDLVAAVQLLSPSIRDRLRIRCVGEGPMRAEIEAALDRERLTQQVVLEGSHAAAPFYLNAQYALLISHEEGLPNAVLEAMAAGLAVVATDVGGCRELVQDGVTGLLVPARNPTALAAALTRVIQDVDFRVEAGRRGRERATEFSWARNAQAHAEIYSSHLQRKRR